MRARESGLIWRRATTHSSGLGRGVEGSVAESLDGFVQIPGEFGDLGSGDPVQAQSLDQLIDIPSGDALDIRPRASRFPHSAPCGDRTTLARTR